MSEPFVAVGNDELDIKKVWSTCPACGRKIEFPVGELIRCFRDETRPRPVCECGRAVQIGKAVKIGGDD